MKGLFESDSREASGRSLAEADFESELPVEAPQSVQKASLGKNLRPQLVQNIFGGPGVGRRQFFDGLDAKNAVVGIFASHLDILQVILPQRLVIKWIVGLVLDPIRHRLRLDEAGVKPLGLTATEAG